MLFLHLKLLLLIASRALALDSSSAMARHMMAALEISLEEKIKKLRFKD
jgi:hypothetical protein